MLLLTGCNVFDTNLTMLAWVGTLKARRFQVFHIVSARTKSATVSLVVDNVPHEETAGWPKARLKSERLSQLHLLAS